MMPINKALSALPDAKPRHDGGWMAKCPGHGDTDASLSVKEREDGKVIMHCFGGCGWDHVVACMGLEPADMYPKQTRAERQRHRREATTLQVWQDIMTELFMVMHPRCDGERLSMAINRLRNAATAIYGQHHPITSMTRGGAASALYHAIDERVSVFVNGVTISDGDNWYHGAMIERRRHFLQPWPREAELIWRVVS